MSETNIKTIGKSDWLYILAKIQYNKNNVSKFVLVRLPVFSVLLLSIAFSCVPLTMLYFDNEFNKTIAFMLTIFISAFVLISYYFFYKYLKRNVTRLLGKTDFNNPEYDSYKTPQAINVVKKMIANKEITDAKTIKTIESIIS